MPVRLTSQNEGLDAGFASGLAEAVVEGGRWSVVAQGQVQIGGGVGRECVLAGQRENKDQSRCGNSCAGRNRGKIPTVTLGGTVATLIPRRRRLKARATPRCWFMLLPAVQNLAFSRNGNAGKVRNFGCVARLT